MSASGLVTALSPGATTITATSEGRSGTASISVADGGFVLPAGTAFSAGGGRVAIEAPAGAVSAGTAVTVASLTSPPADPDLIPGNAWTLGPASVTFAQPVTVQLTWLSNTLPTGTIAEQVRVHRWDGAAWVPLANGSVNVGTRTASGTTTALGPFALIGPKAPTQTTFMVTTTADAGAGSLRQAILDANATPGADQIHFNIAGAGPHTILPTSALPAITDPVTIDGLTQPGASCAAWPATLRIELRGSNVGSGISGLALSSGSSTVRGLVINQFNKGAGIRVTSDGNTIACNYLGTDVTGMVAIGSTSNKNEYGVLIDGGNTNLIGGSTPIARNLLSNNEENGVRLRNGATANVVSGNFIGTNVTGTAALENRNSGVYIIGAPSNRIGGTDRDAGVCNRSCNLISGNDDHGIEVFNDGGDFTVIQGNFIGTDIAGTAAVPNERDGIIIDMGWESAGHRGHVIGGATGASVCSGPCNLISGNAFHGIRLDDRTVREVTVYGNFIGTTISGTAALPNGNGGVNDYGTGNLVGGATPGLGNLISGNNGFGVNAVGFQTVVQGNRIGTAINGASPLGNLSDGIRVSNSDKLIGGTSAGQGNIIAHNGGIGIFHTVNLGNPDNNRNSILGNSSYQNGGLGIKLCLVVAFDCADTTPNDPGDVDTGANDLQNYPVLGTATLTSTLAIAGTLNSTAAATFRIEFFSNVALDPTGRGEGEIFLGFVSVTTDGSGNAAIAAVLPATGVAIGRFITATATNAAGSTSEFSAGIVVQ